MRGWQSSGSLRANKHWQSNKRGVYKWEKNPFSGYTSDFTLFSFGYNLWNPSKGKDTLQFSVSWSSGVTDAYAGMYGGVRTGSPPATPIHDTKQVNGCMADVRGTGCGVIHIRAVVPASLADVTFTIDTLSNKGFQYIPETGSPVYIYNANGSNDSGSNDYVEWHSSGADLNSGYNVYVKFKDKSQTQAFVTPVTGYMYSNLAIKTSRILTDEEISTLSAEGNKDFLIKVTSGMITEETYESTR